MERSSDGWCEWNGKLNEVLFSKKLCNLLNIEISERTKIKRIKKQSADWWKEYMEDTDENQEFFKDDTNRKRSIETAYSSKTENRKGRRISKVLF